jgi:hypothetical protein
MLAYFNYKEGRMNYEEAVEQSRKTATENLIEDALIELTSLHDNPSARMRLLAVIGLDDIEASLGASDSDSDSTDTDTDTDEDQDQDRDDLRHRIRTIKNHIQNFIYSRIPPHKDPAYEDAMYHIDNTDPHKLPSYSALLPIHLEMCEEEERQQREEMEAIERAEEEQLAAERAAIEAAKAKAGQDKENARLARLKYYENLKKNQ